MAIVTSPTVAYMELVPAFVMAGVGMSLYFAPVANLVLSTVRRKEEGKASGVNNTIREVGGVFGVAVLASVFSAVGGYVSPQAFVDGMTAAVWVGAIAVALAGVAAVAIPPREDVVPDSVSLLDVGEREGDALAASWRASRTRLPDARAPTAWLRPPGPSPWGPGPASSCAHGVAPPCRGLRRHAPGLRPRRRAGAERRAAQEEGKASGVTTPSTRSAACSASRCWRACSAPRAATRARRRSWTA